MDIERLDINAVCLGILCNFTPVCGEDRAEEAAGLVRTLQSENEKLRAELEQVKRALAMMWFAYVNSDKETPHSYETEALVEAEHILGPWSECMPIYLSRGQKEE